MRSVEVRSSVPRNIDVALRLETVREQISVVAEPPLLDPRVPSQPVQEGRTQLDRTLGTTLGRSVVDVVTTMPGWLLEANAVLHPRGSEYDTQYVIDGLPLYDNRSIAFAPPFETDEFEAVRVLTAGIPAEYGTPARRSDRTGHAQGASGRPPFRSGPPSGQLFLKNGDSHPPVRPSRERGLLRVARRGDRPLSRSALLRELHELRKLGRCQPASGARRGCA